MTTSAKTSEHARPAPTREEFSERLLNGSVKKSYAPIVDIDWEAPLDPDKFFLPPKTVSLYGTPLWDSLSRQQRIELSRQEFANTLSAGIWFENILNQALLRRMMHQDPTTRATHYELTELGDEARHMVMFGKAIERVGAKPVRPRRYQRIIINALPLTFRGSLLWVAALVGEEIFDSLQRQMMDDPELQPMVQRLMRIHVIEEARHIQFARDGLRRRVPHMRRFNKVWVANINGVGGLFFRHLFTNRVPYRRAGLDARTARRVARSSAHRRHVQVIGFAPLAAFLDEVGLLGPIARRMWRRSGFPAVMIHHVLAIGLPQVGAVLRAAGINDVVFAENSPARWMFDEHTHTWTVAAADGEALATRVVLSAGPRPPGCANSGRPYAGVALPGVPNFFLVPDDSPARMRYVADCLTLMDSRGCTRMEVRYSSQRVFHEHIERGGAVRWRHLRKRIESAFDLCAPSAVDADIYDGVADIDDGVADIDGNRRVRVRLTGHLDPIDGRYHWQGTVFDKPPDEAGKQSVVRLTIGGHSAPARITELTPWGSYSVAGIGAPPFALDDAVLSVPLL